MLQSSSPSHPEADKRQYASRRLSQLRCCAASPSGSSAEAQAAELLDGLDPQSTAAIYRHGGGNPFYLEQLARARKDGVLPAVSGADGDSAAHRPWGCSDSSSPAGATISTS
jgi:hypothetical protein